MAPGRTVRVKDSISARPSRKRPPSGRPDGVLPEQAHELVDGLGLLSVLEAGYHVGDRLDLGLGLE
jgi:hypothetical protein